MLKSSLLVWKQTRKQSGWHPAAGFIANDAEDLPVRVQGKFIAWHRILAFLPWKPLVPVADQPPTAADVPHRHLEDLWLKLQAQ